MANYPMDKSAKQAFDIARSISTKYSNEYVGTEHLLYGILNTNCASALLFRQNGLDLYRIIEIFKEAKAVVDKPIDSPRVKAIMLSAYVEATQMGASMITADHLMLAMLKDTESYAVSALYHLYHVDIRTFSRAIKEVLRSGRTFDDDSQSSMNMDNNINATANMKNELPAQLEELGVDVTKKARENKLDPVIGRENEVSRIIEILCRKTKNNPVLIGEPGVGKSAIIDGLAQAVVDGRVPRQLQNKIIFSFNIGSLLAGTKYRGELEERLKNAIELIIERGDIIVFIDELHTLMQAGSKDGEVSPADILKPYLARGEMQTIGATTTDEYRKYIEKDKAMERRFQPIIVEPPTIEQAIGILKGLRQNYENFHKVKLSDEAIVAAVKLSDKYIADRFLPDKAIDLIDEAMSCAKVSMSTDSSYVKNMIEERDSYYRKMNEYANSHEYAKADEYKQKYEKIVAEIKSESLKTAAENEKINKSISAEDIADIVSRWTKIPVNKLTETESERLCNMEAILHKRVIGQNKAVEAVSKAIRRARAGLKSDNRPIGSFIFLGPTGVGKTELTKALAEAMFDDENSIIRLDMSEFMEAHSVSKLIGAPPGYVGFDDGGQLTEKVRRHPYSVVLFDEIEKAHPDVFNALLQILDDGRLTDSRGRTVSFKNTIIIMTSNVGAAEASVKREIGFNATGKREEESRDDVYMKSLRSMFRPEFLNRIDVICVFDKLTKDDVGVIAQKMLQKVENTLKDRNITLTITQKAIDWIIEKGYDAEYGARPLRRVIEQNVEDEIAENIINGNISNDSNVKIDSDGTKLFLC